MIWIDSISQLSYYNRGPYDPCYCDLLVKPGDLTLQGQLGYGSVAAGTPLKVYLYSTDGLTNLGEVTDAFQWYLSSLNGLSFFVLKLVYFDALMCANPCFVLRVTVGIDTALPIFDKFTEQYCLDSCCVLTSGVTITGTGITQNVPIPPSTPSGTLGESCYPILRLEVKFDCIDRFTGEVWDDSVLTSGVGFAYTKVLNIKGTMKEGPREISRSISQNCKVQKTESILKHEVQSFELFPLWKKNDIENMLHANHLWVNGKKITFPGGQVFTDVFEGIPGRCKQYFRLVLPLQECKQYQIFGCGEKCAGNNVRYFGLRQSASSYHDEAGRYIGSTFDELKNWFRVQGGITDVSEVDATAALSYYKIFSVAGTGYIPTSFYAGGRTANFRIFGRKLDSSNPDYNSLFGVDASYVECQAPATGVLTIESLECQQPVIGELAFEQTCQQPFYDSYYVETM